MVDDIRTQMALDDLASDDLETRIAAMGLLGQADYKPAVPDLIAMLREEDETVRAAAIQALGQMHGLSVLPSVLDLLRDDNLPDKEGVIRLGEDVIEHFARDIHDGLAAKLAAAAMGVTIVERLLERDPERLPEEIASLKEVTGIASKQVRDIINNLRAVRSSSESE